MLEREGYITGLLDVTIIGGCLMERDYSREPFGFSMSVLGLTRIYTTVNKLAVTSFQCIMPPLFVNLDMFDLVVPYLFST